MNFRSVEQFEAYAYFVQHENDLDEVYYNKGFIRCSSSMIPRRHRHSNPSKYNLKHKYNHNGNKKFTQTYGSFPKYRWDGSRSIPTR